MTPALRLALLCLAAFLAGAASVTARCPEWDETCAYAEVTP